MMMSRSWLGSAIWVLFGVIFGAVASAQSPYLAVNGANHDYLTLNYYIDEDLNEFESLQIEFWPNEGNVAEAQIWSNLGRRDYATLNDQDAASVPGPNPAGTSYFVGFPLTQDGQKWVATMPIDKTGAYRLTARYRLQNQNTWKWVGGRDTAVMVSPKKARDVILYEMQVNVINATGDTEATRSTFEDLMNPAKNANLDYFENLGINTLWIQPIHPIGDHYCVDKSQGPGSPYSIQNMWEVAPFMSQGNTRQAAMAAFTNFAAAAGARGIDFFFDIIFNHTSWDAEIGQDPDNPSQPAVNPAALIKDILPQWYSRYNSTWLPCGEYDYNQNDFQFWLPAQNANQIGPAPAERNDFGKWPDVADLFWGTYPALFNPQSEDDTTWDVSQAGADVKRMTEYFAYFGTYWIERSGGTLGGFRCDYAQGLPPQAWEYFVNKIRQTKWDFIFMAESLDGGPVSRRAGRHMDIINQNWVWQVLGAGGNTTGLRGIIDANKQDYGFAGIMRGLINHDQNAPADKWYSFSRYAVGAVVDGAPQMYQGQELGYTDNWGFSRFRFQFGRWIPDIFKWHNMMPLWNNQDLPLKDAYSRLNRARLQNLTTRLHDQWYLDRTGGQGPDQQIFSVLKYDRFGWDPAHQNVVLNFVNLTPWTGRGATFDLATVQAIYINPSRNYNVRNLLADDPNVYLWPGNGRTGQDLINNGLAIDFPSDGIANPDRAFVQMLVLEEHGGNQPVDPWVTWDPENPVGCGMVTIRYRKADSPLGAGPVHIYIGRNGWQDIIEPAPQMANDGDFWVYYHNVLPGTFSLNFVFNDGNSDPDARVWDNNAGQDWSVAVTGCTLPTDPVVWTDPVSPEGCDPVTIYYDASTRNLSAANPVYIHIGYNGWNDVILPNPAMTSEGNGVWSYTYDVQPGTEVLNFVFNNGSGTWDNNSNNDWSVSVADCPGLPPPPSGFVVTNPPSAAVVAHTVSNATLQGIADNMTGSITWTNSLTGASGSFAVANPWTLPNVALGYGANVFTLSGTYDLPGGTVTTAVDVAANYGTWTDGSNEGTGFGAWAFNHSQGSGFAGSFVGDPASAGISGMPASSFGFYANPPGSGANAEVSRSFSAPMAPGDVFHFLLGLNWDSDDLNSNRGFNLRAGATELININMGNSATITINGNPMFTAYGTQAVGLSFEYVSSGSIRVWGTGRDGVETYDQTLTVPAGAPSGFSLYFNATSVPDAPNQDNRQMYANSFRITSMAAPSSGSTNAAVTITRLDPPVDPDSNGDGIPDWWYIQYGLNPLIPNLASIDSDSDGMTNWEEYIAGTHPVNGNSFLHVQGLNQGAAVSGNILRWPSVAGRVYDLHRSENLLLPGGGFSLLQADILATPPLNTFTDTTATATGTLIYRLEVDWEP
ncbi:MAG TPA: carbohydrate-binding protein [Kiritimatiellia bacterium]|nr:carbohydrate-binding protein [Kiritimatiellia bacterium]